MAYLTLRGIAVARAIERSVPEARIVEIHPGACMALRGAEIECVRTFKSERSSRGRLLAWLAKQGLASLPDDDPADHVIAAYACALAAWKWSRGECVWLWKAAPPFHPFDFAC